MMSHNAQQSVGEKFLCVETFANIRNMDSEDFPIYRLGYQRKFLKNWSKTDENMEENKQDHVTRALSFPKPSPMRRLIKIII